MSYLREVIFAALACGILVRIAPSVKHGCGKYAKYAATLAFLCVFSAPAVRLFDDIPEFFGDISGISDIPIASDDGTSALEVISREICRTAAESAAKEFGVEAEDFEIKLTFDGEGDSLSIKNVCVYPKNEAGNISKSVLADFFSHMLSCEVDIIGDDGE